MWGNIVKHILTFLKGLWLVLILYAMPVLFYRFVIVPLFDWNRDPIVLYLFGPIFSVVCLLAIGAICLIIYAIGDSVFNKNEG